MNADALLNTPLSGATQPIQPTNMRDALRRIEYLLAGVARRDQIIEDLESRLNHVEDRARFQTQHDVPDATRSVTSGWTFDSHHPGPEEPKVAYTHNIIFPQHHALPTHEQSLNPQTRATQTLHRQDSTRDSPIADTKKNAHPTTVDLTVDQGDQTGSGAHKQVDVDDQVNVQWQIGTHKQVSVQEQFTTQEQFGVEKHVVAQEHVVSQQQPVSQEQVTAKAYVGDDDIVFRFARPAKRVRLTAGKNHPPVKSSTAVHHDVQHSAGQPADHDATAPLHPTNEHDKAYLRTVAASMDEKAYTEAVEKEIIWCIQNDVDPSIITGVPYHGSDC